MKLFNRKLCYGQHSLRNIFLTLTARRTKSISQKQRRNVQQGMGIGEFRPVTKEFITVFFHVTLFLQRYF